MTSSRSRVPLVLAIISVVTTPVLWFIQFFGMWMEGAIGSVVVIVTGALTLVLPVSAFATGSKAKTKAPQIIGGIVGAICLAWQVWVTLSATGVCVLLEGC
jgi:hypothetical protein